MRGLSFITNFFEQAAANAPLTSSVTGQSATRLRSVIVTKGKRKWCCGKSLFAPFPSSAKLFKKAVQFMIEWLLMVLTQYYLFVFRALTVFSKVRKRKIWHQYIGTSAGSLLYFLGKKIRLPADARRLRTKYDWNCEIIPLHAIIGRIR